MGLIQSVKATIDKEQRQTNAKVSNKFRWQAGFFEFQERANLKFEILEKEKCWGTKKIYKANVNSTNAIWEADSVNSELDTQK